MAATPGTVGTPVTEDRRDRPGGRPRGRRLRPSRRLRTALGLLVAASALVVLAAALQQVLVLVGAAVLAAAAGWATYALARSELVATRAALAAERSGIAESYRALFDRRGTEATEQQRRLLARLAERDRTVRRLRGEVETAERRAGGTEAMLDDVRRRLAEAEQRWAAMAVHAVEEVSSDAMTSGPGDLGVAKADEPTVPIRTLGASQAGHPVPEWARLEADPVEALLAWEEHAGRVTGSHAAQERERA